jgi:pyrimidine operon attenuation protein / uracil phosphoribosyltransferase
VRTILTTDQIDQGLERVAVQLGANPQALSQLILVGIRRGGVPLVQRLAARLRANFALTVPVGSIDITLYRDDAATALPNPRIGASHIPASLDGKWVLLVDDVLYTRRTIRAALDALLDYGRPEKIELFALVDRAGRQLPIQADYWVCRLDDVGPDERVDVIEEEEQLRAVVQSKSAPSFAPPKL